MTAPDQSLREKVARLINPFQWRRVDRRRKNYADHITVQEREAWERDVPSLLKADAILALLSPPDAAPDEAELRRLAEAATPGPWHSAGGYLTVRDPDSGSFSSTIYHLDEMGQKGPSLPYQAVPFASAKDAAFIAAANPARILSLLDALAAARANTAILRSDKKMLSDFAVENAERALAAERDRDALQARLDEAEAQRDDKQKALLQIAEGNLGPEPWQANYETIRQVARNAAQLASKETNNG